MLSKILKSIIVILLCEQLCLNKSFASDIQVIENVSLSQNEDIYNLRIEFYKNTSFIPRIHTLPNGLKIFLSFRDRVKLPKIEKANRGIIKGYFFEKFGTSSLMFVMALNEKVQFLKKSYTKTSINITFKVPKKYTIIIDAGHGGKDPGTQSPYEKYFEKNITLVIAIELRNELMKSGHYSVVLTRDSDTFIPLDNRLNYINSISGDLLISLHTDYNKDKNLGGISVYTLPQINEGAPSKEYNLNLIKSRRFAKYFTNYVPRFYKIRNHTCRNSDLKILKNSIPSVLIELGCISNKKDSKLLLSRLFREKIIYAILYALDQFFEKGQK